MPFREPGPTSFADSGSAGASQNIENSAARAASKIKGAVSKSVDTALVNFRAASGEIAESDLRARIIVPATYLNSESVKGSPDYKELEEAGGIIFPYTPQINFAVSADYASSNPTHSNYTQYYYKSSKVGDIAITARYSVQNSKDAAVWLATRHLLMSLTKMRFGIDSDAGAPPPVCRLFAYGDYMMKDVPIVIQSVRVDLPEDVDYFNLGKPFNSSIPSAVPERDNSKYNNIFGESYVPTLSRFVISCLPLYSRREILNSGVSRFLEEHRTYPKYL